MATDTPPASRHVTAADARRAVARFAPFLRIVHQIPGRVRFKLGAAALNDKEIRDIDFEHLRSAAKGLRGIREIQFNALARSCVVEYDNRIIADAAWSDLLSGRDSAAADALLALLLERSAEVLDEA